MLSDRPAGGPRRLMVVAGEVSGDLHAARLVQALRARAPDVEVFGVGGDHLRAAGAETVFDIGELAVTGFTEVLRHLPRLRRLFQALQRLVDTRRPDAVLLVDYPGFNLRLAERLHARGVKTLYYVCPQVWAWHRARIPRLARCVDRLMAFFPFEAAIFEGTGLQVDVVGHPLVDDACAELERPAAPLPWPGSPRVALLPGSRRQEIERVLPPMLEAAALLTERIPGCGFLLPAPNPDAEAWVRSTLNALPTAPDRLGIVLGEARQVLREARAALVCSGTATLEAALMRCPMVITYRVSPLSAFLIRRLIRIPFVGLVNIVAGRAVCPERLQEHAVGRELAAEIEPLLTDDTAHAAMQAELDNVRRALGAPGAAARAADIVAAEIGA